MRSSEPADPPADPVRPRSLKGLALFLFAPAAAWSVIYLLGGRQTWQLVALIIFLVAAVALLVIAAQPAKRGPNVRS